MAKKIILKRAEVFLVLLNLVHPFTTSFGTYKQLPRPFVKITTNDGYVGFGEIPTLTDPAYKPESDYYSVLTSLEKFIMPAVKKHQDEYGRFLDVEDLRKSYAWIKGANFAKSGVEAAFWDIIAQKEHKPLWKLWRGSKRVFSVGVSIGGKTKEQVLEKAAHAVALGYKRLKVKVWPGFELTAVKSLREQYPHMLLQIDANSSYTMENWKLLKPLDQYGLLLIEQPLYDDDVIYHSEISRHIKTPICLDESVHSLDDAKRAVFLWEKNKILDRLIINIKPPRVSGFYEAINIARFCGKKGVKTWIGGMLDSAWGKAFNLNFNALKEISLPGDHFSPTGSYFEEDVTKTPLVSKNGGYSLTNAVSTGCEINRRTINKLGKKLFSVSF